MKQFAHCTLVDSKDCWGLKHDKIEGFWNCTDCEHYTHTVEQLYPGDRLKLHSISMEKCKEIYGDYKPIRDPDPPFYPKFKVGDRIEMTGNLYWIEYRCRVTGIFQLLGISTQAALKVWATTDEILKMGGYKVCVEPDSIPVDLILKSSIKEFPEVLKYYEPESEPYHSILNPNGEKK